MLNKLKSFVQSFLSDKKLTTIHPKTNKHIEYVFSCGGIDYFQFTNDWDMPRNRFRFISQYYNEMSELKMDKDSICKFMEAIKDACNNKDLVKAGMLASEVSDRASWLFDPDSLHRLASVIYFDLGEVVTDYDIEYNNRKIKLWQKKKLTAFFMKILINESESFFKSSEEDLDGYIKKFQKEKERQQKLIEV